MSNITNLRIITELGELVYKQVEDLNLNFNRIVDDYTDISNRFGDFSYEFNLPIIKENSIIFGAPESIGSKGIFPRNRNIACKVFNDNQLILDGLINLEGITKTTYKCKFYSKFKELIDVLNEKLENDEEKTLKSLNLPIVTGWTYEDSIIQHINSNYKSSDETFYQYPLTFYSTFYCENQVYSTHTDDQGYMFFADRARQNYYFLINNIAYNNHIYYHQIPPAIYLVSIVEQILQDAGWTLGGQFFNQDNIKKIILLYNGEDDPYDKAIANTTEFSGSTPVDLQMAKFLPDMSQSDFIKGIINMFNLYFIIDTNNRIIQFETYNTFFRNTDDVDPYDITDKVDEESGAFGYFENNNPTLTFKPAGNRSIFGDSRVMSGATNNAFETKWVSTSDNNFNLTFNKRGYIDQGNALLNPYGSIVTKIEVPFDEPTIKRQFVYNNLDINGVNQSALWHSIYLPMMTKQTPVDNNNMKFNLDDADTYLMNNESSIKFNGNCTLMYYYGLPTTTLENKSGKGSLANYMYINIFTDTGTTLNRVQIPVVSPFQLMNYRDIIENWLNGLTTGTTQDRRTVIASYLQSLWQMMVTAVGVDPSYETDYSLVFDDNGYFHNTLWSVFHKYKWDRLQQSEMFSGNMYMNSVDWNEMQINRPILYRKELYSLISIEGYNPILGTSAIKLIKKL
jgi:hypothetical protein